MKKRTNICIGLLFSIIWALGWWFFSRRVGNSMVNGLCVLAGWFADDAIRLIRKRKTA